MKGPQVFVDEDDDAAVDALQCYYGIGLHEDHGAFSGASFDTWDTTGDRDRQANHFTVDDLLAVTWLSVSVGPWVANELLVTRAAKFEALFKELGPDRDLIEEKEPWPDDWAGWRLWSELKSLPSLGSVTVSKLMARKRPKLRPIYDSVVSKVIGSSRVWDPLRAWLQKDPGRHRQLLALRDAAGLPEEVSAIRVFDVLAWMEGTGSVKYHKNGSGGRS